MRERGGCEGEEEIADREMVREGLTKKRDRKRETESAGERVRKTYFVRRRSSLGAKLLVPTSGAYV